MIGAVHKSILTSRCKPTDNTERRNRGWGGGNFFFFLISLNLIILSHCVTRYGEWYSMLWYLAFVSEKRSFSFFVFRFFLVLRIARSVQRVLVMIRQRFNNTYNISKDICTRVHCAHKTFCLFVAILFFFFPERKINRTISSYLI